MTDQSNPTIAARRPEQEPEPVAWRYRTKNSAGNWSMWCVTSERPYSDIYEYEAIPLYATPQAGKVGAVTDEMAEAAARAHDQEDAAQKGEPSPWTHFNCDADNVSEADCPDCREFRSERMAAMRAGLDAALAALAASPAPAAPTDEMGLKRAEQKAQGERCGCRGGDDYCPCQNTPDHQTRRDRASEAAK